MAKPLLIGMALIMLMVFVMACGSAEESDTPEETPEQAVPTATAESPTGGSEEPTAEPTEEPTAVATGEDTDPEEATSDIDPALVALADALAGKPGAIYIGDGNFGRLVGTAPGVTEKEDEETGEITIDDPLGDGNGMVPLEFVEKNRHIFETDYYRSLIDKAKLLDPTPLTSSGEQHDIQYACINRALLPCVLQIEYFAKNVKARTNGQVDFEVSSYPELGLAGSDMIELVESGTIEFAQIQPAYVGGTWPLIDIIYVWGLWDDFKPEHEANTRLLPFLDAGVGEETGGGQLIYHIWYGGNDQYFFSNRGAEKEDFDGLKTRSHGTTMTDAINGLGGEGQFMAFAEVYTALERGILDAGVTGAHAGHGQRWYEVTDNLIGPFISMPMGFETMNSNTWNNIPENLKQIVIEEGAKMELENLRLAAVWNETGVQVNVDKGMTFMPWSDEMQQFVYNEVALGRVLPNWIKRVGPDEIAIWNDIVAPWAKVQIEPDGSLTFLD